MAASTDAKPAHSLLKKKRTSDVLSSENANVDFASLMLSPPVEKGLTSAGFERPSPIQLKAIPLGRCGLDLIVQAKSGTGKTCVFSVIALESIIASSNSLQILILAPTREIAIQIQDVIQAIGCAIEGLKCHAFIGGTIFGQDRQNLKKCHIAVGTPGRIKQLIEYDVMKTDSVRLFILDEADKLLDEKFQASVNWIYHQLPENKQMLALSATYPESLAQQLTNYMRDPTFVRLNPRDLTLQGIKQFYKIVPGHDLPHKAFQIKADVLVDLLSQIAFNQCLIFSNLQSRAQNLCDVLLERGWPATFISGNQEQGDRMKAMAELKSYKCRILISTDLTARGIDAENVNLIINLDVSKDFKTYLHRIGRAGRFGTHGAAITLASEGSEVNLLQTVQKKSGSNIKLLPDLLPSNLLELSFHEVETEVLFTPESETLNNDSGDIIELLSSSKNDSIDSKNLEDTYRHETLVSANDDEKEAKIKSPNFEKGKTEDSLQGRESSEVAWQNDEEKEAGSQHRDLSTRKKDEDDIHRETDSPRDRNPSWSMRNELQDWMVPMAILQQVKETRRQPWQWDDVVRLFEDGECGSEKEVDNKSTNDVRGLKYHSTGDIIKHDEDIERSVRSCQLSGLETTLDSEQLYSQTMSRECGRSKAENIDEFGHPGDSDILAEFKAVRDLLEKFKMEEAVIEEQASSQSLAREDDDVDQDSSKLDKRKLKACSESLQLNGYSSIHFKRKTEVLDCQNRKEIVEREEFQQDMGITDKIDHGADTLDDNSGRNGKRNLSAQRNVTENFSFCKEDKTAKKRQSNLMKNARQYNVAHLEGKRQSLNDSSTYEACVGDGASRMRLQDQQNSDEEKSIHQNTSSRNNDKWFQFHSQECRSSDNIWEYFKFVARINSQSMFPPQGKNSLEQGKEDTAQIQKGRNSVLKVENDLKSCTVNNREDDETNKANSEQSSGSMEDSHDPLTSDYSEEHNQFTETGNCSTNADQYRLSYGLSNSGNRSERSTVNSESNSIPEFAGTIEDIPDPTADCSEEGAYFQYWMGNCNGAEGWGNSYGTASVLWDGQTTHCNQQFTPHYYESFYPYV